MSKTQLSQDPAMAPELEQVSDPIEAVFRGDCLSLTERSSLTFEIGRHSEFQTLHLRLISNTGGGMFCNDWASATALDEVVKGAQPLTAKVLRAVHPGRSVNTAGFLLAVLKHLGMARVNEENTRLHEHVPTTSFDQVAMAAMQNMPSGRKGRGAKNTKG